MKSTPGVSLRYNACIADLDKPVLVCCVDFGHEPHLQKSLLHKRLSFQGLARVFDALVTFCLQIRANYTKPVFLLKGKTTFNRKTSLVPIHVGNSPLLPECFALVLSFFDQCTANMSQSKATGTIVQ